MVVEKEYKTGFSTVLKISTIQKIDEFSTLLKKSRGEIGRRIIEYFIEHNDIEDIIE